MKCFRYIFMGHEIFFIFFDGSRSIVLCSFLILKFCNFIKGVCEQNVPTGHQGSRRFKKTNTCSANQIHSCYMIKNGSKNQKKQFLMHFDTVTWVSDFSNGAQDKPLWQPFLSRLYPFHSLLSGRVWSDGPHHLFNQLFVEQWLS